MATEIKKVNGLFQITGSINASNSKDIKTFLENTLLVSKGLLLSVENVIKMDSSGAYMLESLYKKAGMENLAIYIFGQENSNILDIMANTNTDYILSNDRI